MGSGAPGATSDRELWQRAADDDGTAFGEILERHAQGPITLSSCGYRTVRADSAAIVRHPASRNPEGNPGPRLPGAGKWTLD
jgi:hypothetical protein